MYKSLGQLLNEASADVKENKYDILTHDICKAIGLFSQFGDRYELRTYDNYDEAIYLARVCRKIAKNHNGNVCYAYEMFLKMYANKTYEKNLIRNEETPIAKKYSRLDYYRWFNCTGNYALA